MSAKENRYRLLLELYPADFRREYAEEMIGVLMADPRPVRQHAAGLAAGAVAARLRQTLDGPQWRRAAFVVQLFGAILLCAVALRRFAMSAAMFAFEPAANFPPFDVLDVARVVVWAAVVAATMIGLRRLGAAAALAGLIAEIAAPSRHYIDAPARFLDAYWIVMTAALVLIASTSSATSAASVRGPRPRGWLLVVAGGVVLVASGFSARSPYPAHGFVISSAVLLAAAALALTGVIRLEPVVRRRVVACMVPVAAVFPLVGYGFGGLLQFNLHHPGEAHLLGPVQWAALIVVPALAFWVAAGLNLRLERSRAAGTTIPPDRFRIHRAPESQGAVSPDRSAEI
jgi:hypothetical protein